MADHVVERSQSTPETYPTQAPSGRKELLGDILVRDPTCFKTKKISGDLPRKKQKAQQ